MTRKQAEARVVELTRSAICVKAPGRPPLYWVHAEHMPYLGEGPTEEAAWESALARKEKK